MNKNLSEKNFRETLQQLKSEWNSVPEEKLELSESSKRSLFLQLREIEAKGSDSFSFDLFARYVPQFSLASAFSAALCFVTFQLSQADLPNISMSEFVESDYSELFAGSDLEDDFDSSELIVDEQQEEV